MDASFVVGFHTARTDNLLQTLRFLAADHADVAAAAQLVLVTQDSDEAIPKAQQEELLSLRKAFRSSRHFSLGLPCMCLPQVTNWGVDAALADKVIILESDRLLPAGYFASVLDQLRPGVQITCTNMKKLTAAATDAEVRAGTFAAVDEHRDPANRPGMRNMWSGNTAVHKRDYYRAGGMDEAFKGYGWADTDMTNAMAKAGVESVWRPELELHLWHPPATYGAGDQKQMFLDNGVRFCKKWEVPYPDFLRADLDARRKVAL